ncbi:hypothetical protein KSP39_PZI021684 [Platanthera zijinensis]|uniref:Uncharacterized protein n=1 Tax=Platanthera zijinensis TaxID=2320716 RepID=A0AAP0AYT5_9ASPA
MGEKRHLCQRGGASNVSKDQFRDYLLLEAERRSLRPIIENKSHLVLAHSTSGYNNTSSSLSSRHLFLKDIFPSDLISCLTYVQVRALKEFFDMLSDYAINELPPGHHISSTVSLSQILVLLHRSHGCSKRKIEAFVGRCSPVPKLGSRSHGIVRGRLRWFLIPRRKTLVKLGKCSRPSEGKCRSRNEEKMLKSK